MNPVWVILVRKHCKVVTRKVGSIIAVKGRESALCKKMHQLTLQRSALQITPISWLEHSFKTEEFKLHFQRQNYHNARAQHSPTAWDELLQRPVCWWLEWRVMNTARCPHCAQQFPPVKQSISLNLCPLSNTLLVMKILLFSTLHRTNIPCIKSLELF